MTPIVQDEKPVLPYDPLRHDAIDRGRLQHLGSLLDNCAFRMGQALSGALRRPTRFSPGRFEQGTWDEFRTTIEESTFIMTMPIAGLEEKVVLHAPTKTSLSLYEVQMGADTPGEPTRDAMTDLEFTMVAKLATTLGTALRGALYSLVELGTTIQTHRSPHALRMGKPGDACFRVQFSVTIGDGKPKVLFLFFQLATVRSMLEAVEEQEDNDPQETQVVTLENAMFEVPFPVEIAYPPVLLRASDVLTWRVGTTFSLGIPPTDRGRVNILVDGVYIGKGIHTRVGLKNACVVEAWERSS